jgi:hypothetical protein
MKTETYELHISFELNHKELEKVKTYAKKSR